MVGIDFVAVTAHSGKPSDVQTLGDLLQSGAIAEITRLVDWTIAGDKLRRTWLNQRWDWSNDPFEAAAQEWPKEMPLSLDGPGGLVFDFYARALSIYHVTAWQSFCTDSTAREMLRRACRKIAAHFGKPRAVYVPDSVWAPSRVTEALADGRTLRAVEQFLAQECGPPAATIEQIGREEDGEWEGDGYFVDDFRDY